MPSAEEVAAGVIRDGCETPAKSRDPATEDLVNAVRAGEKSAFSKLVLLYERAAIITARSVLRDHDRAQDAAQEAFVIAYTKLDQLRTAAAFGPWLLKIVRRRACLMQRQRREVPLATDTVAENAGPTGDWLDRYEKVIEAIARLPEHERVVVVLRYINGRSVQKIAETTGESVETTKKQLSRALARLRKWLRELPS